MKKIVSVIKPFIMEQNIFVYEDGNKINVSTSNIEDLDQMILKLADEYEVTEVNLLGPTNYSKGLKTKIENAEITKYKENKLEIKLIKQ